MTNTDKPNKSTRLNQHHTKITTMTKTFNCSECNHEIQGPNCAISMTINCPSCENTTTAYN